jgi:hypothetical protein
MTQPLPPSPANPPRWATSVAIPTTWTPAQALAVFELLDDLRETVATLYLDQMQAHLRQEQGGDDTAGECGADAASNDDLTF